jgi:hypothetical protein
VFSAILGRNHPDREKKTQLNENPEAQFFYTTHNVHQWTSGPTLTTLNPDKGFARIESLEEAKELAEKFAVGGYGDNRCVTTYGVQYRVDEQKKM